MRDSIVSDNVGTLGVVFVGSEYGRQIRSKGTKLDIVGCEFYENNVGIASYALIHVDFGHNLTIQNSTFYNNTRETGGGGVVEAWAEMVTITSSVFRNNRAVEGGAVAIRGAGSLHVEQSFFIANKAAGNGGAIDIGAESSAMVTGSLFHQNTAERSGGAVRVSGGSRLDMVRTNFTENRALVDGGAVHLNDGSFADVRGAVGFGGNVAKVRGGGLSLVASTLQTDESAIAFTANKARLGGGVSADEQSSVRIYAGCLTVAFEMHWSDSPQASLEEWAVVRRTGDAADIEASLTDAHGTWMFLRPTAKADTSTMFCLPPGKYDITGYEGGDCNVGWEGGFIRALDRRGNELATLTMADDEGCWKKASLTALADAEITNSTGLARFEGNTAAGSVPGFCGEGCGGALYVGTVRRCQNYREYKRRKETTLVSLRIILCRRLLPISTASLFAVMWHSMEVQCLWISWAICLSRTRSSTKISRMGTGVASMPGQLQR